MYDFTHNLMRQLYFIDSVFCMGFPCENSKKFSCFNQLGKVFNQNEINIIFFKPNIIY